MTELTIGRKLVASIASHDLYLAQPSSGFFGRQQGRHELSMSGRPGRLVAVLSVLILLLYSELGIVHVSGISNVDHSSCIDSGTCKAKPGVTKVTEDASRQQGSPAATTNGAPPTDGVQSSLPDRPEALAEPTEPTSTVPTPQPDVGLANTTLPDAFKEPTEGRNSTGCPPKPGP